MILEEIRNISETKKDLRKFGLSVGIVLFLLAVLLFYTHKHSYYIFGSAGIFLITTALTYPGILKPLNKIWMTLAIIMGWVMTRVILTILFFIILPPISITAKIFKKDFLDLKIDKSRNTYWEKREKKYFEPKDYENQF